MIKPKLILLLVIIVTYTQSIFARTYMPYVEVSGMRFFSTKELNVAANFDLFVPLWQKNHSDLLFTDLRIHDHSGVPFEGNLHLGYRYLFTDARKIFGIYGSFDRRRTAYSNYISQVSLGSEFWLNKWFIGANLYKPIGSNLKYLSTNTQRLDLDSSTVREIKNFSFEKALPGFDFEIGYEFIPGLIGYAGGYYFNTSDVDKLCGPRARLTYELTKYIYGKKVLGVFDVLGLEVGMQHDKPRDTIYYASIHMRFGLTDDITTIAKGITRHMLDPVRRDIEIITRPMIRSMITDIYSFNQRDILPPQDLIPPPGSFPSSPKEELPIVTPNLDTSVVEPPIKKEEPLVKKEEPPIEPPIKKEEPLVKKEEPLIPPIDFTNNTEEEEWNSSEELEYIMGVNKDIYDGMQNEDK